MLNNFFKKISEEEKFWIWFAKNQKQYYHFEKNQNNLFQRLKYQLNKIDENLVFEFSPILENKKREFVISADGIKSSFSSVVKLVELSPSMDRWDIIPFRQPRKAIDQVNYEGLSINYGDVFFKYTKLNGKIGLELNIRGFYESPEWTSATFILLDNILGEYHAEMSLDFIKKKGLDEKEKDKLLPITQLPKIIKNYQLEISN